MNDLDDLLLKWKDGGSSAEDLEKIKQYLEVPEARVCLVAHFFMSAVIVETLKAEGNVANIEEARSGASKFKTISRWVVTAAAVVLLGLGIVTVFRIFGNPVLPIAHLHTTDSGSILVRDGQERVAEAGLVLQAGDVIQTAPEGSATIRYEGEESQIELGSDTRASFTFPPSSQNGAKTVHLTSGNLQAVISKQALGAKVSFTTPHAQIAVLGTHLRLVSAQHLTRLEVEEGSVQATRTSDHTAIRVSSGQRTLFSKSRQSEVRPIRVSKGLLALYLFEEGAGNITHDVSGIGVPATWRLVGEGGWEWVPGGLKVFPQAKVDFSALPAKVRTRVAQTQEVTLEMWVEWETTPKSELIHFLATRATGGAGSVYINGILDISGSVGGDFDLWFSKFRSYIDTLRRKANAPCKILRLMAVYDRAFSPEEVALNYTAGAD